MLQGRQRNDEVADGAGADEEAPLYGSQLPMLAPKKY